MLMNVNRRTELVVTEGGWRLMLVIEERQLVTGGWGRLDGDW